MRRSSDLQQPVICLPLHPISYKGKISSRDRDGRRTSGAIMKGVSSAPGDYIYFKSQVPLHKISIGSKQWRYYDFGPKIVPPLICLPGIAGTADVYYKQIMSLSMKGYRVISVDIPRAWNHVEWIQAFEKFLDTIDVHHVHLYGSSLGGFLAQLFAQHRPRRVRSLILSNSFLDTRSFKASMPWSLIVSWTPSFLLKRFILTGIRDGPHEPFIADSVDFVVCQVETLSRDDLASRLSLNVDAASVGSILLSDSFITIMDTNDYCAIPQQLKDQLSERYPGARRAYLKTGGDFPFLSRPDEVNLHLQLHLRRVGVEARPDLVPGTRRGGNAGSPSNDKDESEDIKDPPKESGDRGKDPPKDGGDVGEDPPEDGGDEDEDTPKDGEDGDEDIDDTQDGGDEDKDPPKDGGDGGEDNNDPSTDGGDGGLDAGDPPKNVGDGAKDVDNPPKDHEGPSTSAAGDSAPAHGTNNSHSLDEPVLNSAKTCLVDCKSTTFVITDEHLLAVLQTALNRALVLSSLSLLPLYMVCCCTLTRKPLLIV